MELYETEDEIVLWQDEALIVTEMNERACAEIAEWNYDGENAMYSFEGIEIEREQLFNGLHFAVYFAEGYEMSLINADLDDTERARFFDRKEKLPCGFISVGPAAQVANRSSAKFYEDEKYTDIGLGLHPRLCGLRAGLGDRLVRAAVQYVKQEFPDDGVRLTVAKQNRRAQKVYLRNGFSVTGAFLGRVTIDGKRKYKRFLVMQNDI